MAAFLLPWRVPRCRHGGRLCFKIDLPSLCGALPGGRAVDGISGEDGLGRAWPLAVQPPAAPRGGRKGSPPGRREVLVFYRQQIGQGGADAWPPGRRQDSVEHRLISRSRVEVVGE